MEYVDFHGYWHFPGRFRVSHPVERQHLRKISQVRINKRTSPINRTCNLLSVLTLESLPMRFLYLLHKSMNLVALHHLHSGEGHHHLLFLMNLVMYPLTLLLLPWRLITRRIMVVVIIHFENQLVDLLVKASYFSILRHHDHLTTLEILHTCTISTILSPVHNQDQRHQLPTVAVLGHLCSKLTQVVNLLGLHSLAQLLLSALLMCMCHMSKIILLSKR